MNFGISLFCRVLGAVVVTVVTLLAILPASAETAPVTPDPAAAPPASAPASPSPIASVPVVTIVRDLLAAPGIGKKLAKNDVAAALAFYNGRAEPIWFAADALSPKAKAAADEIGKAADYGLDAKAFDLPQLPETASSVEQKADVELKLTLAALTYARHARGGRISPESVSRLIDQRPPVKDPKAMLTDLDAARESDVYLRGLHPKHEQFERLRQALLKARSASAEKDVKRLQINMERWRWLPDDLGRVYVMNNIPEFMSRLMKDGKPLFEEKIIVGQTSWPTPVFSADMKTVVFNPSWGVPDGIKSKELQPRLKKAGGGGFFEQLFGGGSSGGGRVLRAYKLQATLNGRPVDPDSIDWNTVDIRKFHFSQPPGAENPLGKVKFLFPNDHDVYMHDTPDRSLFAKSSRALSHGCMRLQNPKRFAEILLAEDKGWSSEKVSGQYSGGGEVALDKPVPVHVVYLTATVDDTGQVKAFGDLYGLDSRMSSALYGATTRFNSEMAGTKDEKPESDDATADDTPVKKGQKTKKVAGKTKPEKPSGPIGGDLSSVVSGGLAN